MTANVGAIPLALTAAVTALIGAQVYLRKPSALPNKGFGLMAAAIALWTIGIALNYYGDADRTPFTRFVFASASAIPIGTLTVAEGLLQASGQMRLPVIRLVTPVALGWSLLSFTPFLVVSSYRELSGLRINYGPLYPLFAAYIVTTFSLTIWLMWKSYRRSSGALRLQMKYLLLGFSIPIVLGLCTNLFAPLFLGWTWTGKYGPFFILCMIGIVGHAVIRHRFMDIRVVIRRGAVYGAAILTSVAIFALLLLGTNVLLPDEHDLSLREILLALLVAICFFPVKGQVQRLFDQYLYRNPYDYARTLREASGVLTGTIELPRLLGYIGSVVTGTLKPEAVAIYLWDPEDAEFRLAWSEGEAASVRSLDARAPVLSRIAVEQRPLFRDEISGRDSNSVASRLLADLDALKAEVVVPLLEAGEVIGVFVVAPKRSGDPFFSDDADLLTTLANQSAVAIRNAQTHARVVQVNEELQKILGTIESGVIAVGPTGRVSLFNRAAERFTGVSAQAALGEPVAQLPGPLASALEATVRDGMLCSEIEFSLPDAAGQVVPLIYSTSPLLGHKGQPLGAVAVIGDLSRLKELEQERQRAERLASIEAIASGLVHEIRNPLVGIKTFSQLLPSRGLDAEFRESFSRALSREIGRIDDLLSRFRTLSVASRQTMEPLDVTEPLRHTLELLRPRLEQSRIYLRQVADGVPRPILGNASQLEQLFLNLCLNAVEAMDAGGELTVRVADLCEGGGTTLLVEVSDTGPGIPAQLLNRIFEPFVTTKARGTGLGLAICRGIADAHHARLVARNNTGRPGSTFTLEFPVAVASEAGVRA